jgi:hypothetical protein
MHTFPQPGHDHSLREGLQEGRADYKKEGRMIRRKEGRTTRRKEGL